MQLYPAIDLKDGCCVRLLRGDMSKSTVFNLDAGAQASAFYHGGARNLHVVDLNGAFKGRSINARAVRSIRDATSAHIQLGGGIRTIEDIKKWLDAGIDRVILGTVAVKNPDIVKQACKLFPNKIAVAIDAKKGYVAVEGWAEVSKVETLDLARRYEKCNVAAIIYTDIELDGLMGGVNVEATEKLANKVDIPIIASGGVSIIDDIIKLKNTKVIKGVISGRALYDEKFTIAQALAACKD